MSPDGSPDKPPARAVPLPAALRELDLTALMGLSIAQARSRVERAGGVLRTYREGEVLHLDHRPRRITAMVEDDHVVSVHGFG